MVGHWAVCLSDICTFIREFSFFTLFTVCNMCVQLLQIIRSQDGSADNSFHLSTTHAEAIVHPCFVSLCPLVDASLDTMLGCTDHSRRSDHSERSSHSRRSYDLVNPASATRSDSANTKVSGVKGWTCGHTADRLMTSTQVDYCPLETLPCLDVSAVDQTVTDSVSVTTPGSMRPARTRSSHRAACDTVTTRSNITQNAHTGTVTVNSNVHGAIRLNGFGKKHCRHSSDETVDVMTHRHDTSSDAMLLSDQQEEQRLVELTKTGTKMSEASSAVPSRSRGHGPVLVSRGRSKHKKTLHREPGICMPLSGSETFTQQSRRSRQASDPRWDVDALCAPKRQRKLRRVRKLYTEDILLPAEDTQVTVVETNDTSLSRKVLKEKTMTADNDSQPDSCIIISSSPEHCTPVSPVDDAVRSSDHIISSTDHSDSVASTQQDASAVQRLEVRLLSVEGADVGGYCTWGASSLVGVTQHVCGGGHCMCYWVASCVGVSACVGGSLCVRGLCMWGCCVCGGQYMWGCCVWGSIHVGLLCVGVNTCMWGCCVWGSIHVCGVAVCGCQYIWVAVCGGQYMWGCCVWGSMQ